MRHTPALILLLLTDIPNELAICYINLVSYYLAYFMMWVEILA